MCKKVFERFEIRQKEEKVQCLPLFQEFFSLEAKKYPPESFLAIQNKTYYQEKVLLSHLEGQIVAFMGEPNIEYTDKQTNRKMYKIKIAYLKTQENQKVFDYDECKIIETLNEYQGILEFLDTYLIPYEDHIRIAIEYRYGSITRDNLRLLSLKIVEVFFILDNSFLKKTTFVQSYTKGEFREIFNNSSRNKKIIFYSDVVDNNGIEILNSVKHEYSLKCSAKLGDIIGDFVRDNFSSYNAKRYVIKCEDSESKTASFEGGAKDFESLQDWVHPARISSQNTKQLFLFLSRED